jgi:hypothetical protein
MTGSRSSGGERIVLFSTTVSRPAVGSTQPPILWTLRTLSAILKGWSVKLATHLHLVFRSKMRGLSLQVFTGEEMLMERDKLPFAFHKTPMSSY